jgi:AcrR family transcriptional regulator
MTASERVTPAEPKQARAHATRRRLLDAAVEELLEHGYAGLTTPAVARRAGVSRGAQQNYFPHKATLVAEAVRHLALRQRDELRDLVAQAPRGRARVRAGLDILFEQYSGPLFAAMVELSLAARGHFELEEVVAAEERTIGHAMHETAAVIFGDGFPGTAEQFRRWATVLSAIRGLALLKLLGHPHDVVDRQWPATRRHMLALLS